MTTENHRAQALINTLLARYADRLMLDSPAAREQIIWLGMTGILQESAEQQARRFISLGLKLPEDMADPTTEALLDTYLARFKTPPDANSQG